MILQERILDLLNGAALRPRVIYQVLHEESRDAIDAALKDLRQTGRVVLLQGRFERPGRQPVSAEKPLRRSRVRRSQQPLLGRPLTSREVTVAIVAAEGGTAAKIAVALGISPRTLSGHLSNIYAKLGVSGRTELAQWIQATGAAVAPVTAMEAAQG